MQKTYRGKFEIHNITGTRQHQARSKNCIWGSTECHKVLSIFSRFLTHLESADPPPIAIPHRAAIWRMRELVLHDLSRQSQFASRPLAAQSQEGRKSPASERFTIPEKKKEREEMDRREVVVDDDDS